MDKNIYDKLTDSAKSALEQTIQEFTDTILEKAYQNANFNNTADKEISLYDIIEAKEKILYSQSTIAKYQYRRRRSSLMFSMVGAVYAVFGILFYLYQNSSFDVHKDIGLIIAALGILLSIMGFFYTQLVALKNKNTAVNSLILEKNNFEYEVIKKWQKIEELGGKLMLKEGISDNRATSINFIIEFLSKELSDSIKIEDLKKLLITRNQIVHKGIILSKIEIEKLIMIADEIIDELNKQIRQSN